MICTFEARKAHWVANEWAPAPSVCISFHAARLLTCRLCGSGACTKTGGQWEANYGYGESPCGLYMCCLNLHLFQVDDVFVQAPSTNVIVFLSPESNNYICMHIIYIYI